MKSKNYSVQELTLIEQKKISGGNPVIIFIAGAILGGIVYDVYKAGCKALLNVEITHPEYYDGPVHTRF